MPLMPVPIKSPEKKPGRNDPCWCGSGKKYKKCHLDRDKKPKVNPYEIVKEATKDFERKFCSHPDASPENCNHIIKAHSITKGFALNSIEENRHVYTGKSGFADFAKNKGKMRPKKIGVNQASTFMGFCGAHDNATFEPIEQGVIPLTDEGVFLLSYRTIALEAYNKAAELKSMQVYRGLDHGWKLERQIAHQTEMDTRIEWTEVGLKETNLIKEKYDRILINKSYEDFYYLAIRVDQHLPIVSSGGRFPDFDYDKNKLYEFVATYFDDPPMLLINIVNDNDGAVATIAWTRNDPKNTAFAESFLSTLKKRGIDFLVHMAIASSENTYYRPSWWESLDKGVQNRLCEDALSDTSPDLPMWCDAVANPVTFGLQGEIVEVKKKYEVSE